MKREPENTAITQVIINETKYNKNYINIYFAVIGGRSQ